MKRIIWTVVVLAVLVVVAAPFGFGYLAENRFEHLLQGLANSGELNYTVVKVDRGWFNTTTDVTLKLTGDIARKFHDFEVKSGDTDPQPLSITVRNHIHNGPFAFGAMSHGSSGWLPSVAIVDSEVIGYGSGKSFKKPIPLHIRTRFALFGGGVTRIDVPAYSGLMKDGKTTMNWKGLVGRIHFDQGLKAVRATITAPSLDIADNQMHGQMSDLSWRLNMHEGDEKLWVGQASIKIGSIAMEPKVVAAKGFKLAGASMHWSRDSKGGAVNGAMQVRMRSLAAGGLHLGQADYAADMRNIDAKALSKLAASFDALKKQNLPPRQLSMMMGATLFGELPQLLARGPVLEISKLSVDTGYGRLNGTAKLTVDTSNPALLSNPLLLKKALIIQAQLQIPQQLVTELMARRLKEQLQPLGVNYTDAQIRSLAKARINKALNASPLGSLVIQKNGMYLVKANFKAGQLTVNGQSIPLPMPQY